MGQRSEWWPGYENPPCPYFLVELRHRALWAHCYCRTRQRATALSSLVFAESIGGRGMNRLPVIDDCETAADVMIRARRVEALRFEMIRPIVAPPPTVAPKVTPPPIPKKEPKPEPPIDLPNFLALPPYEGTVVTWPVVASRPI